MTSHGVLQSIDVNSKEISDRSPARKRVKYSSPEKTSWSIKRSDLILDEIFDCGLGILDSESDTENSPGKEITSYRGKIRDKSPTSSRISKNRLHTIPKPTEEYYVPTETNYFDYLSDEVILYVLHFLPKRLLTNVALVCRRWHCLTQDESLWSRMDISKKNLQAGAIGHILSRQVVILRLSQSDIASPAILPGCRASFSDFEGRLLYLDLSMAHISQESLTDIFTKCKRLKKLSLENVPVNKDVMKALSNSKDLEVLNLSMVEGLDLLGIKALLPALENLRELNLAWTCLSSAAIDYVCLNLPEKLDRLNFAGCRKLISDKNVIDIISCCSGLRELDLSDSTGLTGDAVTHITLLDDLNFLALSRCYSIPYRALLELRNMSSLMYLDVHGAYIDVNELRIIQEHLGARVNINKFKFSSVARPTVGLKHSSIWNLRVRD